MELRTLICHGESCEKDDTSREWCGEIGNKSLETEHGDRCKRNGRRLKCGGLCENSFI